MDVTFLKDVDRKVSTPSRELSLHRGDTAQVFLLPQRNKPGNPAQRYV